MKILHVTEYCHAGSTGGTERYVVDLVRGLDGFGVKNAVVWLTGGSGREAMEVEGIRVLPLPAPAPHAPLAPPALRSLGVRSAIDGGRI